MRIFSSLIFVSLTFVSSFTYAHQSLPYLPSCEQYLAAKRAITIETLREMSADHIARNLSVAPVPGFTGLIEQSKLNPVGETGPLALQQGLGMDKFFVASPAPNSTDPITVALMQEASTLVPVHVDVQWQGKRTSTTVYTAVPGHLATVPGDIISREFPLAVMHLHGGGTPTAGGKNLDKVAENLLKAGIPSFAPDLPGHGRAPRQFEGFLGFKEQCDWVLEVADKMLHPNTKIMLSGHSWGAMFAIYMQRLAKMDPKYKRIVHLLSIAPGIDPTLGGTPADRTKFEEWYQANFRSLKERIAATDFEFQENVLNNGKDSDVGAWFTGFTNLDYSLPPLTAEEYADLIPMTVIVGTADGVVYVGFEDQFEKLFAPLGKNFIKLAPGPTFKSKDKTVLFPTGHQVFDREIMPGEEGYDPSKTTYQVYRFINNLALQVAGGARFPEAPQPGNSPSQVVDSFLRNYLNFFGFRMLMANSVEYIDADTDMTVPLAETKNNVDYYLARVVDRRSKTGAESEANVMKAIVDLRARLGITELMTLEGAKAELDAPPLTPEREAALNAFITTVRQVDEDMLRDFKDPEADAAIEKLRAESQEILAQAGVTLENIRTTLDQMNADERDLKARRNSEKAAAKLRGETVTVDPAQQKADNDRDRFRKALANVHQNYTLLAGERSGRFGREQTRRVKAIVPPAGIVDQKMARRELAADRSPERRALVARFIAEYGPAVAAARQKALDDEAAAIASLHLPKGIESEEKAWAVQKETDARKSLTYVPEGRPEIAAIVQKITEMEKSLSRLTGGDEASKFLSLKVLKDNVRNLETQLAGAAKGAENGWAARLKSDPQIQAAQTEYDQALDFFTKHYYEYEHAKSAFLNGLDAKGQRNAETIGKQTPELLQLAATSVQMKNKFLSAKAKLDSLRPTEGMRKLEANLKIAKQALEERRREISLLEQNFQQTRKEYIEAMIAAGEKVPLIVKSYDVFNAWNQPLEEVKKRLETDRFFLQAMTNVLSRWEGFMTELRPK